MTRWPCGVFVMSYNPWQNHLKFCKSLRGLLLSWLPTHDKVTARSPSHELQPMTHPRQILHNFARVAFVMGSESWQLSPVVGRLILYTHVAFEVVHLFHKFMLDEVMWRDGPRMTTGRWYDVATTEIFLNSRGCTAIFIYRSPHLFLVRTSYLFFRLGVLVAVHGSHPAANLPVSRWHVLRRGITSIRCVPSNI